MVNYTDEAIPYTRIIEHKHFEKTESPVTWLTYEYPIEYQADKTEPYYPVNDSENNLKYSKYKELSELQSKHIFGGRLGQYKYYDMHQVIKSALDTVKTLINK
jgi:UDP-galactopyranose mutase